MRSPRAHQKTDLDLEALEPRSRKTQQCQGDGGVCLLMYIHHRPKTEFNFHGLLI